MASDAEADVALRFVPPIARHVRIIVRPTIGTARFGADGTLLDFNRVGVGGTATYDMVLDTAQRIHVTAISGATTGSIAVMGFEVG